MVKKKITLELLAAEMRKGFASLQDRMERGFASGDRKFEALASDVGTIKDEMATKEHVAAVEKRLDDRIDGAIVKIDGLQNTLDAQTLVRADQQLPERVSAIEKHLGMSKNIAA